MTVDTLFYRSVGIIALTQRLVELFAGHNELILGLNIFLPVIAGNSSRLDTLSSSEIIT